ncbi:hypothetical protein KZ829_22015 [Actinoplanes hulinensis]|uniref:Acyl-CoA dehydrogenase/oxidase C-terminal domain-containing protein n=1 Tax=Actinoplanes hulinensis TaxID=1144547 RepID=A0ABS7B5V3_9ACTN|nr:hypothetical protein [Actinoplanes hulinensis]MBW6436420.1 hypothetical protein [Actinoplanes hulinensis]
MTTVDIRRTARSRGLAAAIAELHGTLPGRVLPCGPTGCCVLPEPALHDPSLAWTGATVTAVDPAAVERLGTVDTPDGPLAAIRYRGEPDPDGGQAPRTEWLAALAELRLGLSEALLDTTMAHLGDRRSGDTVLLLQQMIKGALADAVTEQLEVRVALTGTPPPPDMLAGLHRQITMTDRMLLRLLGASGFTADGPGLTVNASELLADAWIGGEDES